MNFEAYRFLIPRLWPDVVEILLVAFVIYRFLLFLVGTRAMSIGSALGVVLAYDERLLEAAREHGLPAVSPSD